MRTDQHGLLTRAGALTRDDSTIGSPAKTGTATGATIGPPSESYGLNPYDGQASALAIGQFLDVLAADIVNVQAPFPGKYDSQIAAMIKYLWSGRAF